VGMFELLLRLLRTRFLDIRQDVQLNQTLISTVFVSKVVTKDFKKGCMFVFYTQ